MGQIEVLLATVNKNNYQFINDMNVQTDIIIANQANTYNQMFVNDKNRSIKMITTSERGVGRNRNIALSYSTGEYCVLADDDMIYNVGYESEIIHAFKKIPQADILIFNCKEIGKYSNQSYEIKKLDVCIYGIFVVMVLSVLYLKGNPGKKNPIFFSELYGGGTTYGAGEDTLFLRECLKKGLKVYTYPYYIATINQDSSSWFEGYNEKYFYDKGALLALAFPYIKYLLSVYFAFAFSRRSQLTLLQCISYMFQGIRNSKQALPYSENKIQ